MQVRSIITALRYDDGREVPVEQDWELGVAEEGYRAGQIRIVAIRYEDGSLVPVEHAAALTRAVAEFFKLRELDLTFPGMTLSALRDLACELAQERQEMRSEDARKRGAAVKRPDITTEALLEFRRKFKEKNKGKERGWRTAAAIEFECDEGTVRERMRGHPRESRESN